MKKLLIVIAVALLVLCGCKSNKTDADFAREYEVSENTKVKYVDPKDIDSLFKGTHVAVVTTARYKEAVQVLCQETAKYDALYIYYVNSDEMDKKGISLDINEVENVRNAIVFVKENDVVDYIDLDDFTYNDKDSLAFIYDVILESMTRDLEPGCSDGC